MTEQETADILAVLSTAWPSHFDPQKGVNLANAVRAYQMAWSDLPQLAVSAAVGQWLRVGRFFPAPSEIRELVIGSVVSLDSAEQAWGEVKRQIAAVGMYGRPRWSSEPLAQAVQAIGWRDLCLCEEDAIGTLRAHFYRTYESYRKRHVSERSYPELVAAKEERAVEQRLEAAERRALPEPRFAAWANGVWEDDYRAIGEDAYSTVRARERHSSGQLALPPSRERTLEALQSLPAWRDFPESERQRLLERYGRTEEGDGE